MEVILRHEIKGLGPVGERIRVKDGYARNFLIPNNMAVEATAGNLRLLEREQEDKDRTAKRNLHQSKMIGHKIRKASCTIVKHVGEEDRIHGSVTSQDIVDALRREGIEIEKKQVSIEDPIRQLGIYNIPIKLHEEVTAKAKVWVVKA